MKSAQENGKGLFFTIFFDTLLKKGTKLDTSETLERLKAVL